MRFLRWPVVAAVLAAAAFGPPARANITIVPVFDPSILTDPNAQAIEDAINASISQLQGYIATPTTVTILFRSVNTGLGSSATYGNDYPYATYLADLRASQTLSANDITALGTLPDGPNNPANGDPNVHLTSPLLRAVGEAALGNLGGIPDSTIDLYTGICNFSRTGPIDPDKYDLEQVTLHEMCEVLGAGGAGSALPTTTGAASTLDIYRYSGAAIRSFKTDPNEKAYFSIDGGATNLGYFNQSDGGDYADWSGDLNQGPQVQDAFSTPAVHLDLTANELIALDVVGYNLTPSAMAVVDKRSNALLVAGGLRFAGSVEHGRLNVEAAGPSAGVVDLADAVRLARKSAGLRRMQNGGSPVVAPLVQVTNSAAAANAKKSALINPKRDITVRHLLPARASKRQS